MYVTCCRCGKIHPRNYKCYKKVSYKMTDERKKRSSYIWKKKAMQIKNDAFGLCEVCKANGIYTYNGLEVHHIVKIKDNSDLFLEDSNLICLCVMHHKQADAGELSMDYLKELAEQRINH